MDETENPQGYYVSGFEIASISDESKTQSLKLIEAVAFGYLLWLCLTTMFNLLIIRPDGKEVEESFIVTRPLWPP